MVFERDGNDAVGALATQGGGGVGPAADRTTDLRTHRGDQSGGAGALGECPSIGGPSGAQYVMYLLLT